MTTTAANDLNTAEYWNRIWQKEGLHTWRTHPGTFDRVAMFLYGMCGTGPLKIIEIGCGVGVLAQRLAAMPDLVAEYAGIDISDRCFDACRRRILAVNPQLERRLSFHACDVNTETPPVPPGWPDAAVCTETLEHLREDRHAVDAMYELTRPGGYVIASVPDNCLGPDQEPEHIRAYDADGFTALFETRSWKRATVTNFEEWYAFRQHGTERQIRRPTLMFIGQRV